MPLRSLLVLCVRACVCACARTFRCLFFAAAAAFVGAVLLLCVATLVGMSVASRVRLVPRLAACCCLRASVLWLAHYTDAGLILSCMRQFPDVHVGSLV